jgi:multiple sugar transport system permease protein
MSTSQQALATGPGMIARPLRRKRRGGLHGAEMNWAIAFAMPYVLVFFAFVVYPVCYGLWMGSEPALYTDLFSDPRYATAVLNTLIYVGVGVNLTMALAFVLSGFFMRKSWWTKSLLLVFLLPWATPALPAYMSIHWLMNGQWGLLNNILYWLFAFDGPIYLNDHWTGLAANIGAYIWKNLPFWTLILLSGRMAIPQELYEAAEVDGATGLLRFKHVTAPLMANLYIVCTLLDTIFAMGDFNATYFVSGGGPAMSTEVLATLGIRYAFTSALPRLGVATVMTALPVLVPLVFLLMRRLHRQQGQL